MFSIYPNENVDWFDSLSVKPAVKENVLIDNRSRDALYTVYRPPPTHAHTNTHMLANLFHMFSCFLVFFRKLEDLSVDEFMQAGFASESDEETKQQSGLNKRNKKKQLESKAFTTWVFWSIQQPGTTGF